MLTLLPTILPLFIVIIVVAAMNQPLRRLKALGARSPETARPLADIPAGEQRHLRTWIARGVVRESPPGMFWYDAEAQAAHVRRTVPWIVGLMVMLLGGTMVLLWMARRG